MFSRTLLRLFPSAYKYKRLPNSPLYKAPLPDSPDSTMIDSPDSPRPDYNDSPLLDSDTPALLNSELMEPTLVCSYELIKFD